MNDRCRRRLDSGNYNLVPVQHSRDLGGDVVHPMVALIDGFVNAFALAFAFKPAYPDVQVLLQLSHKAAHDYHAFRDLEGDNDIFHEPDPVVPLAG